MHRLILVVLLAAPGCLARLSPIADGKWLSGEAPGDPGEYPLRSVAGEYDTHAFFGWTALQIGTDGRWTFRSGGIGGLYAYSSGTARVSGVSVVLEKNDAIGFPTGEFVVYTPVRWCDRRYLFGPDDYAVFCNDLNWGHEPDRSMFGNVPLRDEGAERLNIRHPVSGAPELPKAWLDHILRKPVVGVVREQLPEGRLRVDVGSADGVFREMDLRTEDEVGRYFVGLRVESLSDHECVLKPAWAPEWMPPEVGWKVRCDAQGVEFAPK